MRRRASPQKLHPALAIVQTLGLLACRRSVPFQFCTNYGDWGRELALYLGWMKAGIPQTELALRVGGRRSAISMALKRFEEQLGEQKALQKALAAAGAYLQS